jgi:hypothetical protein
MTEIYHMEDLVIDGRIHIKIDLVGIGWEDVDWIHLGQDKDQWR